MKTTHDRITDNGSPLDRNGFATMPQGWCCAALGDIADITSGITKGQRHPPETVLREVPYLRVANVQRGFLDLAAMTLIAATEDKIDSLRLQVGDVLFTEGGDRDKLGRGWVWNGEIEECIHQNHIFRARLLSAEINPRFVSYHGNFFGQDWFQQNGKQTTNLASINQSVLRRFPVPIPPSAEQDRIVVKIEELFSDLDAGVAALKRAKANLKRYRAAVLKAAVEGKLTEQWRAENPPKEPASKLLERILKERRKKWEEEQLAAYEAKGRQPPNNWRDKYQQPAGPDGANLPALPEGWCWVTIAQLNPADRTCAYGVLQPGPDVESGIPFVRVCDIADGKVFIDQLKHIAPEISNEYKRTLLQGGEVLLTIVGTIGRTAVAPETLRGANTARAVAVIPINEPILPRFIEVMLRDPRMRNRLTKAAHEVARKTLNLEDVRAACLPLAPIDEQYEIIHSVESQTSVIDEVEAEIANNEKRAARLRQSILKRAFEGKLVAQDPNDEPAVTLLERMKKEVSKR